MTTLRIHNREGETIRAAFIALQMTCLFYLLIILLTENLSFEDQAPSQSLLELLKYSIFIGALVLLPMVLILATGGVGVVGNKARPYWVEIGDALTHCDRRGTHVLPWSEIKEIKFDYREWYSEDEEVFSTSLIVTDLQERSLKIMLNTGCVASEIAEKFVNTLVQGLQSPNARSRLSAVKGLGQLGPAGIRILKAATGHEAERVRNDATKTLRIIEGAVSHLQNATTDVDEAVRLAASEAIRRIDSEG